MNLQKSFLGFVSAVAFLAGIVSAQAFPLPTVVTYAPGVVTVAVTNPYGAPVACYGTVQGVRNDGFVQVANFTSSYIPYGMTGYGYTYTSMPFWFVNAYGYADCGFLY